VRIERLEVLRCDAGWRTFSFLKMATADGVVGWSEFNESFGSPGLGRVIEELAPAVVGMDPRASEPAVAKLHVLTRQSRGGVIQQAIAAIENALLDIRGKAAGLPVCALFGGPVRSASRCTGRISAPTAWGAAAASARPASTRWTSSRSMRRR
jgi:galactonate dehydratase